MIYIQEMGDSAIPFSPLFNAVADGDISTATVLLEQGADPNEIDPWYKPLLYTAIMTHDPGMVHLLLDFGADPNAQYKDTTPLLYTANLIKTFDGRYENTIAIAYLLIKNGADFNARNTQGRRAVNRAPNGVLKDFLLFVEEAKKKPVAAKPTENPIVRFATDRKPSPKPARKPSPKKVTTTKKNSTSKKAVAKKASAKKTSAKKTSAKKTSAKKTSAKKPSAKKTTARRTAVKQTRKANNYNYSHLTPEEIINNNSASVKNNGLLQYDPSMMPFIERNYNEYPNNKYEPIYNPANTKEFTVQAPQAPRKRGVHPLVDRL
jgi:hypothetical protein